MFGQLARNFILPNVRRQSLLLSKPKSFTGYSTNLTLRSLATKVNPSNTPSSSSSSSNNNNNNSNNYGSSNSKETNKSNPKRPSSVPPPESAIGTPLNRLKKSTSPTRRATKRQTPSGKRWHGKAIAVASAAEYNFESLRETLKLVGLMGRSDQFNARTLLDDAIYLPSWPLPSPGNSESSGEVYIFENGSFVTWGLTEQQSERFLSEVIRAKVGPQVETSAYNEHQSEFMLYNIDLESPTRVSGDIISIGTSPNDSEFALGEFTQAEEFTQVYPNEYSSSSSSSPSSKHNQDHLIPCLPVDKSDLYVRLTLSYGFTRSTKLAVYEDSMIAFLEAAESVPDELMAGSEAPVKKSVIITRLGELLKWRQQLNLVELNLLDSPEFLWTNAPLESYYLQICRSLEVDSRLRTLNNKIDISREELSMLMELLSTKTSHRLEWIIIVLIFAEIMLAIWRDGLPGSSKNEKKSIINRE